MAGDRVEAARAYVRAYGDCTWEEFSREEAASAAAELVKALSDLLDAYREAQARIGDLQWCE